MAEFEFELEKGSKKFECPNCGTPKKFKRYIRRTTGEYMPLDFGRCDRENSCRYHVYPSKEFFADNPKSKEIGLKFGKGRRKKVSNYTFTNKNVSQIEYKAAAPDFIPFEHLKSTLGNYENNAFVQFLLDLFPNSITEINAVLTKYRVGTYEDYTCFPSIDRQMRICKAKLIRFDRATGKRLKDDYDISSLSAKLKLNKGYKQLFFGEHLLTKYPDKPVSIIEAEKTSVIASLCYPEYNWLASGSKQWLNAERLRRFGNTQVLLYPDSDGFELWREIATDAKRLGANVKVSTLIESRTTADQKVKGYDLADWLIARQRSVNASKKATDAHSLRVDELDKQNLLAQLEFERKLDNAF